MVLEKDGDQLDWRCEKLQVLHRVKKEGNILNKKEGGITGLATSCVGTAF